MTEHFRKNTEDRHLQYTVSCQSFGEQNF